MNQTNKQSLNHLELSREEHQINHKTNLEELGQEIQKRLLAFSHQIKADEKMHSYLEDISIQPAEIILSFEQIQENNKQLIAKSKENPIIRNATEEYFKFIIEFLNEKPTESLDSKGKIGFYLELQIKLHCCSKELFQNFKTKHDITNSPKQAYPEVWQRITIQKADNMELIKTQYKNLKRLLHNSVSSALNELQHDVSLLKKLRFGFSFTKYMIMNDSAKLRSFEFYRKPTVEAAKSIWNMPEQGASKHISKIRHDSVASKVKIFLPPDGVLDQNIDIFEPRPNSIQIRVLSSTQLVKYPAKKREGGCCTGPPKEFPTLDSAIIHMHGGGFIALSSRSMQTFTRKWTNQLGVPVFSVDYRMPPEHPFPCAPNDCLVAYRFILNQVHKYLNIKPTKIYLAGDSAGGNLACSLTALILKHKQPLPQGVYLTYPPTDMRKIFTSSRLYSITDPLLWPRILLLCIDSYFQSDYEKGNDPLASPILLTQEYVGGEKGDKRFPLKWPRTIINVGNRDPLYDDSLMLMQKMVESKIDCELVIYDGLSHGYMNTDMFVDECQKTITNTIKHLKKLIQSNENK